MFFIFLAVREYMREAFFGRMNPVLQMALAHQKT
jgi:hypothetical protein